MKTAEEWALDKEKGFGFSYIDSIEPQVIKVLGTPTFLEQIKQIQLDAWKQGIEDSISKIQKIPHLNPGGPYGFIITLLKDLLEERTQI